MLLHCQRADVLRCSYYLFCLKLHYYALTNFWDMCKSSRISGMESKNSIKICLSRSANPRFLLCRALSEFNPGMNLIAGGHSWYEILFLLTYKMDLSSFPKLDDKWCLVEGQASLQTKKRVCLFTEDNVCRSLQTDRKPFFSPVLRQSFTFETVASVSQLLISESMSCAQHAHDLTFLSSSVALRILFNGSDLAYFLG